MLAPHPFMSDALQSVSEPSEGCASEVVAWTIRHEDPKGLLNLRGAPGCARGKVVVSLIWRGTGHLNDATLFPQILQRFRHVVWPHHQLVSPGKHYRWRVCAGPASFRQRGSFDPSPSRSR